MSSKSTPWKQKLHEIIYEADTHEGKTFDIVLMIAILLSVLLVMLESVDSIEKKVFILYNSSNEIFVKIKCVDLLNIGEWFFTILFTIEYILRIISIHKPSKYIFSFYGIIDFFSTIPKYLSLFFLDTNGFLALRTLRLLRVFRVLKLARFIGEK